jgi:hypothetical protein
MVMSATEALNLTTTTVVNNNTSDIKVEVSLAEATIRRAAGLGLFSTTYNARIIGNPAIDPQTTTDLPPNQLEFFELFTEVGYIVTLDNTSGRWLFSWNADGAEAHVAIYSFRTTFDPSAIITSTTNVIQSFFAELRPIVYSTVTFNGDIDEAAIGGTASVFYEFTIVCDQGSDTTNHSAALKTRIVQQGLGYTTNNCFVYNIH